MLRRLALSLMLLVAGFVAGLVVTGRLRSAAESDAASAPRTVAPRTAGVPDPPRTDAPRTADVQAGGFSSGGPDFTRVAGTAVKGVANISSLQVVSSSAKTSA